MTEPDLTEKYDMVVCAHCERFYYKLKHRLNAGGKYAWECDGCGRVYENDQVHLLQNTAFFRSSGRLGM